MKIKEKDKKRSALIERYIKAFIKRQYPFLKNKDTKAKAKELFIGFENIRIIKDKTFVTLRLPEGIRVILDAKGNFRDDDGFGFND